MGNSTSGFWDRSKIDCTIPDTAGTSSKPVTARGRICSFNLPAGCGGAGVPSGTMIMLFGK